MRVSRRVTSMVVAIAFAAIVMAGVSSDQSLQLEKTLKQVGQRAEALRLAEERKQ